MRIALAQLDILIADTPGIRDKVLAAATEAAEAGAALIVYPELTTIGYPPRDLLDRKRAVAAQWALVFGRQIVVPFARQFYAWDRGRTKVLCGNQNPRNGAPTFRFHAKTLASFGQFQAFF